LFEKKLGKNENVFIVFLLVPVEILSGASPLRGASSQVETLAAPAESQQQG
jgi:hypothetical protein